jgi:hypothetical protein
VWYFGFFGRFCAKLEVSAGLFARPEGFVTLAEDIAWRLIESHLHPAAEYSSRVRLGVHFENPRFWRDIPSISLYSGGYVLHTLQRAPGLS